MIIFNFFRARMFLYFYWMLVIKIIIYYDYYHILPSNLMRSLLKVFLYDVYVYFPMDIRLISKLKKYYIPVQWNATKIFFQYVIYRVTKTNFYRIYAGYRIWKMVINYGIRDN